MMCRAILVLSLIGAVAAEGAEIVSLGQPCRAKNILSSCIVTDRSDGRERFVVANMNEDTGAEIIYIDFERDTAEVYRAPAGSGSWGLMEIPGDRLLMPTFYDGKFVVFDLKQKQFITAAAFPGEQYIWTAAIGGDGRAYGGTYPGAKLGALDLKTYEVEDLGNPSPSNTYLRSVSALPDGRILCDFGYVKPETLIFDPATRKFDQLPKQLEGVKVGKTWNGLFLTGNRAFDGKTLQPVAPPFPTPPADKGPWSLHTRMTSEDQVFILQDTALYRWRRGEEDITLVADIDLRGGGYSVATSKGDIIGLRGQDYFILKPGDKAIHPKPSPGEPGPRPTLFLRADPDGILWGGPHFGQTLFWLDPKTRKYSNTGCVSNSGGEVYDAAFYGGAVYAVAYAGGDIVRYDPREKWDQWNGKNPRTIAKLSDRGYIRPIGTIQLGPDGKLYSGWQAKYGTYGGAIAITDPKTEMTDLIENPLGEQAIAGIAVGDGVVFAGTNIEGNGLPHKKGEWARFGVIDIASKKTVFERTFTGRRSVRALAYDPASKRAVVAIDSVLKLFDSKVNGFADIAPPRPQGSVSAPGDGKLYYGSGTSIIALDISTGRFKTLVDAGINVTRVAVDSKGNVYFSSGVDVYAVRMQ